MIPGEAAARHELAAPGRNANSMRKANRILLMVVGLCLLASADLAGQAADGGRADGERWYSYGARDLDAVGHCRLGRKDSTDESASILLQYELVAEVEGQRLKASVETVCRDDDYLTPLKLDVRGNVTNMSISIEWPVAEGEEAEDTARMAEGKLSGTVRGRSVELALPEHTVTDLTLLEIVRHLPREKDASLEFSLLEIPRLRLKRNQRVVCVGLKTVEIDGRERKLHKFEHRAELGTKAQYWVDGEGELVQFVYEGRDEFVTAPEPDAENPLEPRSGSY